MYLHTLVWTIVIVFCTHTSAYHKSVSTNNLIPCKPGWVLYGNKCYSMLGLTRSRSWKNAAKSCSLREKGGLAVIDSPELQEFLVTFLLLHKQKNAWIGLHDNAEESIFTWDDDTPVNYTNWGENQPSKTDKWDAEEDCVEIRFQPPRYKIGSWNDLNCDSNLPYFCQADKNESVLSPDRRFCSEEKGGGWKFFDSCYHFVTEARSWEDAERHCEEKFSGHLVTILDVEREMFLNYLFPNSTEKFWIGIKMQDQAIQMWSSGWHVAYKNWDDEPKHFLSGTCGMKSKENLWTIGACSSEHPFICETSTFSVPILKKAPEGWRCPDLSKDWLDLGGEKCYLFETKQSLNWQDANDECERKGGNLASIHSNAESIILRPHVKNTQEKVFIGLRRSLSNEEVFKWADGSKLDYQRWMPGEPNSNEEECVEMWTNSMKWNDIPCNTTKGYICSTNKTPTDMEYIRTSTPIPPDMEYIRTSTPRSSQASEIYEDF